MSRPVDDDLGLADVLDEHRRSRPAELAVVDGDLRLTYPAFADRVDRVAAVLRERGVGPGDRVAWLGQNSSRVLELLLAVSRLGAMVCPVNWRQSEDELAFVLGDLQPRVVVLSGSVGDQALRLARESAPDLVALAVDGSPDGYEAVLARAVPPAQWDRVDPSSPALVMYTAAHDGRPGGAMMSQRGLIAAAVVHAAMNGVFDRRPVFLAASPLHHIATFLGVLATFLVGGTTVFQPRVVPAEMAAAIDAETCTWTYVTGPTVAQLADAAERAGSGLASLATPQAYVAADRRWECLGRPSTAPWSLHPGAFGQTEMTGMITYTALGVGAAGAAGRPSPWCLVRIVDADGAEVAPGQTGEITARGVTAGAGYWNRPALNAERTRNGWWHTADLGRREADGSLSFIGPKTRMVKSGKENVYPAEVERCLREHPQVSDAAVIGVPDAEWEQSVRAIVVATGDGLTAHELIEHCRARISSYKKPKSVVFVAELPRIGGQLDRDALDRAHGGGGYPGVGHGVRA